MDRIFNFKKWDRRLGGVGKVIGIVIIALALTGCAESISNKFLRQVDKNITFEELNKSPDQYVGNSIMLGGVIVATENKNNGTLLEIYETKLDSSGEPVDIDDSRGRFLAMDKNYLDSQIYRSGRKVTVVGEVKGVEVRKIGEIDYKYPFIEIKDIYLWKNVRPHAYPRYYWNYYGPWWDPWYGYYPYYYPYWGFYYYQGYGHAHRSHRVK
jgi:outer membrane lipoprotein